MALRKLQTAPPRACVVAAGPLDLAPGPLVLPPMQPVDVGRMMGLLLEQIRMTPQASFTIGYHVFHPDVSINYQLNRFSDRSPESVAELSAAHEYGDPDKFSTSTAGPSPTGQ